MVNGTRSRTESKYILAFTAGALLVPESIAVAKCFVETKSWAETKLLVLNENLLKKTRTSSNLRTYREVEGRLSSLNSEQIAWIAEGTVKDAAALLLVATCKRYSFIAEFISEVLSKKVEVFDFNLRDSDYSRFWEERAMNDSGIESTSAKTQNKIRQTLFRLLREAGLLEGSDGRTITPLLPSQKVVELVARDDWRLLRMFLYSQAETSRAKTKYAI